MIDVDINDRTKTPCQTEGCNWPNYHVCLIGKPDLFPYLLADSKKKKRIHRTLTEEQKALISESQIKRWAIVREEIADRNENIIEDYKTGKIGIRGLAAKYEIHTNTVRKVLHEAAAKGRIRIRRPGENIPKRNFELEEKIIAGYKEGGIGVEPLAAKLGISRDVARKVLHAAQAEGRVTIRPRGKTVAQGAA